MQIKVRTHHVEITEALKEYARKKMEKMVEKSKHVTTGRASVSITSHVITGHKITYTDEANFEQK